MEGSVAKKPWAKRGPGGNPPRAMTPYGGSSLLAQSHREVETNIAEKASHHIGLQNHSASSLSKTRHRLSVENSILRAISGHKKPWAKRGQSQGYDLLS